MARFDDFRDLDNKVLGRSTSRRGRLANLAHGLHPRLAPFRFIAAAALSIVAAVQLVRDDIGAARAALFSATVTAFWGYVCRGLPAPPSGK